MAAYCSNFGHCVLEPPFGGLGTTYDVHLGLIGKRVVDFLLAKRDRNSAISLQRIQFDPKFQVEGVAPPTFLHGWLGQ